jgi:hypothetical protein
MNQLAMFAEEPVPERVVTVDDLLAKARDGAHDFRLTVGDSLAVVAVQDLFWIKEAFHA